MKRLFTLFFAVLAISSLYAQVVINEVQPSTGTVELKNTSNESVDVSGWFLCNFPNYKGISTLTLVSGFKIMPAGSILVVSGFNMSNTGGEIGLYKDQSYSSSSSVIDYIEWGSTDHQRSSTGVSAGTWTSGDFIPAVTGSNVIYYKGSGNTKNDYVVSSSNTLGSNNEHVTATHETAINSLRIYPNPASSIINIETGSNTAIEIFNLLGNKVLTSTSSTVDISSLEKGYYVARINGLAKIFEKL